MCYEVFSKDIDIVTIVVFNLFGTFSQVDLFSFIPMMFFEHLYPIGTKTKLQKKKDKCRRNNKCGPYANII